MILRFVKIYENIQFIKDKSKKIYILYNSGEGICMKNTFTITNNLHE